MRPPGEEVVEAWGDVADRALYDRAGAVWRDRKAGKDHTKADQERAARILRAIGFKKIQLEE